MDLSNEETGIREVLGYYADGMRTADVDVLKKAFHPTAILSGYLGDELIAAPIEGLYEWVSADPAPAAYDCSVLSIQVTGRVAVATVRETDPHGVVIDYFHLLKENDTWSIVSKLWDTEPEED